MTFRDKIVPLEKLATWREAWRARGQRLAATNGCFDILHAGHVNYLAEAREQADALLVGLNSDHSVQALKGNGRPVQTEADRALVLAALESVDGVCIFNETRATQFLKVAQPDVYVKGGDYTVDELPAEERAVVDAAGGSIVVLGHVPGQSSTGLADRIARL
ncbi:MAG: ADP-heptose synthase [Verrucomicrobiales bacterium]|nr:ADP-heptose synthase [Verrucomicrobiales bacterium]|tara:strand:+ start:11301 stop:11786 length:486 start_codon:yes stop_codon:yes gene_type:complete